MKFVLFVNPTPERGRFGSGSNMFKISECQRLRKTSENVSEKEVDNVFF